MEKTTNIKEVKFAPTKNGKDKWTLKTTDGFMSVWDSNLAEKLNKRIGQNVSLEVRPAPADSNYNPTVTDMNDGSSGTVTKTIPIPQDNDKQKSIVAQCLVKVEFRNHADPKPLDILESYRFYLKEL